MPPTVNTVPPARPFEGFDRERATYCRLMPELLAQYKGQYVAIVGDEFVGPVTTFRAALSAGYRRFGPGPLYVKAVAVEGPPVEITRDFVPCRPGSN